jgi:hypothetical protein
LLIVPMVVNHFYGLKKTVVSAFAATSICALVDVKVER